MRKCIPRHFQTVEYYEIGDDDEIGDDGEKTLMGDVSEYMSMMQEEDATELLEWLSEWFTVCMPGASKSRRVPTP